MKKAIDKEHVEFEEDYIALTILCYLKDNMQKFGITPSKQSQQLSNCAIIITCQIMMLLCMSADIILDPNGHFNLSFTRNIWVTWVKFPCSVGLHLFLFPEVKKGMNIMKFSSNHGKMFAGKGAFISYVLGLF